jgi:hypothetical protein
MDICQEVHPRESKDKLRLTFRFPLSSSMNGIFSCGVLKQTNCNSQEAALGPERSIPVPSRQCRGARGYTMEDERDS